MCKSNQYFGGYCYWFINTCKICAIYVLYLCLRIIAKGEKADKPKIYEFKSGDVVKVNHRKVSSSKRFKVVKVNRKTILIESVDNTFDRIKVSAGLLIKA